MSVFTVLETAADTGCRHRLLSFHPVQIVLILILIKQRSRGRAPLHLHTSEEKLNLDDRTDARLRPSLQGDELAYHLFFFLFLIRW